MLSQIKNRIEYELKKYIRDLDKLYSLSRISPLLFGNIKEFLLRKGKRVRPLLFIFGYLGFAKKPAPGLYSSALSLELLHDFMLVHDDIIDKSDKRRGKPSLHKVLDNYLKKFKPLKFNGQDLAIVAGDVMYAMAIHTFLSINEEKTRKEKALRKFIEAAIYTGSGEFIEILSGIKNIKNISKDDIYKIYDLKTAHYTFACPLSTGAMLAGADKSQTDKLFKFGLYLGRAFQIKDDIIGMFSPENKIGKSVISDLQEAKKTILLWHAYKKSTKQNRSIIRCILSKKKVERSDLLKMRKLINESRTLDYAQKEISMMIKKARQYIASSNMHKKYKKLLQAYSEELLSL